jgi:hypothetical protein
MSVKVLNEESYGNRSNFRKDMTENSSFKEMSKICSKYGYFLRAAYNDRYTSGESVYTTISLCADESANEYLPEIYYEDVGSSFVVKPVFEFRIQTTSYGSLGAEDYSKFTKACTAAYNLVNELSKIDFSTLYTIDNV